MQIALAIKSTLTSKMKWILPKMTWGINHLSISSLVTNLLLKRIADLLKNPLKTLLTQVLLLLTPTRRYHTRINLLIRCRRANFSHEMTTSLRSHRTWLIITTYLKLNRWRQAVTMILTCLSSKPATRPSFLRQAEMMIKDLWNLVWGLSNRTNRLIIMLCRRHKIINQLFSVDS